MALSTVLQFSGDVFSTFDIFNRMEKPAIILCNPDQQSLFSLNGCAETEVTLRWNAQSDISFYFLSKN